MALIAALPLLTASCLQDDGPTAPPDDLLPLPTAEELDSATARAWLDLVYEVVRGEAVPPPVAARAYAYAAVAFYEAVAPGVSGGHSLGGQLNEFPPMPAPEGGPIEWRLAANVASAELLRGLFAGGNQASLDAIEALEAELRAELSSDLPPQAVDASTAWGEQVAHVVLAWSGGDGFAHQSACDFVVPVGQGLWEPTPPAFADPLLPCWAAMRTFVLDRSSDCGPVGPPPFSTDPRSQFHSEALEVYAVVENLTAEQRAIADFWADDPGATGTPAGHWIRILSQVAAERGLSLDVAAEGFARIGIGMADAFIACWHSKYESNLLRPVTYIREHFQEPGWLSPVSTPPFPEYSSGHSTQSGAASWLLHDLLGSFPFVDNTHDGVHPPRSFVSFLEAADEAAISRLYGGIHYRAAIEHGIAQGRCIGQTLLSEVRFRE